MESTSRLISSVVPKAARGILVRHSVMRSATLRNFAFIVSPRKNSVAVEDVLEVLNSALRDGTELVQQCRTSTTATLFFRGETMKAKFRKVADRITECLHRIPLAAFETTLDIKRDVDFIVKSLDDAR